MDELDDDPVIAALAQARPDDLPDGIASPHSPAAQAQLERILSMRNTDTPSQADTPPEPAGPTDGTGSTISLDDKRRRPTRNTMAAAAAAVAVAVIGGLTLAVVTGDDADEDLAAGPAVPESNGEDTADPDDTGAGNAGNAPLDPVQMAPASLVSHSPEAQAAQEDCNSGIAERVTAAETPDDLRMLPTSLPDGLEIGESWGRHESSDCPRPGALVSVRSMDGATVTGVIEVYGPYAEPLNQGEGPTWTETTVRGEEGVQMTPPDGDATSLNALTWTEDGASWWVEGSNLAPETVRQVAEALELNGTVEPTRAPATLPESAVPEGFEVAWQSEGPPAVETSTDYWNVELTDTSQQTEGCWLELQTALSGRPLTSYSGPQSRLVTVGDDQDAVAVPQGGTTLFWDVAPGVTGKVACYDTEIAIQIAESLVPVEAGDERIDEAELSEEEEEAAAQNEEEESTLEEANEA